MKVRVVTPSYKLGSDAIIARLAKHLERNGWRVGEPNPRALVNIFIPYCEWRKTRFTRTPIAGWFTHKEEKSVEGGAKLKRWNEAARKLDLRVTPCKLYVEELSRFGPTVQIPHPVELKRLRRQVGNLCIGSWVAC